MFSCCRANPKHKQNSGEDDEIEGQQQEINIEKNEKAGIAGGGAGAGGIRLVAETGRETTVNDKKLIIPTITIENGQTTPNYDKEDEVEDGEINTNDDDPLTETKITTNNDNHIGASNIKKDKSIIGSGTDSQDVDNDEVGYNENDKSRCQLKEEQISENTTQNMADTQIVGGGKNLVLETHQKLESDDDTTKTIAQQHPIKNDDEIHKSSPQTSFTTDDESPSFTVYHINATKTTTTTTTSSPSSATPPILPGGYETEPIIKTDMEAELDLSTEYEYQNYHHHHYRQQSQQSQCSQDEHTTTSNVINDLLPKSCLSRHNSTHTSVKKKVNISTHAEIIEPEALPPLPLYDHIMLADDDDVFSDSLPPAKRESMCAPYIVPDEDCAETAVFAHGLPEWFNNERINDMDCIEPPVTPVGRDELELKRQRLYAELLRAAHAAVEHSVRFAPFGPETVNITTPYKIENDVRGTTTAAIGDCDPDLKPSIAENLEHLVNRLERLVDRLERSISARELEIANRTFNQVLESKRESFDIESTELPPLPVESINQQTDNLNQRIERIETTLNIINDRHSNSLSASQDSQGQKCTIENLIKEDSLENIPTVLEDYQEPPSPLTECNVSKAVEPSSLTNMSVSAFKEIVDQQLAKFLELSKKIGGDVAKQAEYVKAAFNAQLQYLTLATQIGKPSQDKQMELLKPTSQQISAIQDFREKNRVSPFFNHLSAISESIAALGWVCVSPTPGPHVKEMNDAGQFYTNRVLKEWKEKDATHVEWSRAWVSTLTELQNYIKKFHTTGLVWSGKGNAPAGGAPPPPPPIGACPPPPPPPTFDLSNMSLDGGASGGDERSALFAEINQGENITKNLKKVTSDMQTHKNPTLRTGPAPFKPTQIGGAKSTGPAAPAVKEPVFSRDGKKWLIEYQKSNPGLVVDNAEMNNVIYVFKCENSTLQVKGKVNNIVFDSCKKCSLVFDSVVASVEFVNCQSVQMQVLGFVPTISIDKTDGCQMYLSKDSLGVEIVSSKSSEMNVMLPGKDGDYIELALPEQFKTTISGKTLKTVCVDSLG